MKSVNEILHIRRNPEEEWVFNRQSTSIYHHLFSITKCLFNDPT